LVGFLRGLKPDNPIVKKEPHRSGRACRRRVSSKGTNYSLAERFAEGDLSRFPQFTRELGALNARVIIKALGITVPSHLLALADEVVK
jgi:hypothetical protein